MKKAYLVLGNGRIFEGERMGAEGESIGELVFHTGTVGYLETLTDPAYAGQIVMQTFPLIGNYGVIEEDFQGKSAVRGYVVRECCENPSNFRAQYALEKYLKENHICGICGIDTREVTRIIREEGVMNAMICDEPPKDLQSIRDYAVKDAVGGVSCREKQVYFPEGEAAYAVTMIDYGGTKNLIQALVARGCCVTVVPAGTETEKILADMPDGILLSGGPGDPAENAKYIAEVKKLIGKIPVFGIGLGHQIAALALGGKTEKLKYGHHGSNQPVKDEYGKMHITVQNHGYTVVAESLKGIGEENFLNANDGSCEGMNYPDKQCFTVQFSPETYDMQYLYDRFLELMGGKNHAEG